MQLSYCCQYVWSTCPEYAEDDKRQQLNDEPLVVILNVEPHEMIVAKRIEWTQNKRSGQSTEKRPPQSLQWKIITHLHT